jgi:hypothetical protein
MGWHLMLLGASSNQFLWIVFWWIGCEDSPMYMSWNSCAEQPLNQQPEILLLLLYNVTRSGMGELHRTLWGKMEHSFSGTVCACFLLWPPTCFLSDNLVPITYGHVVKGFPSWVLVCWLSFQVLLFLCCLLTHSGVVNNFHFPPRSFFKIRSCKKLCILLCLFLVSWAELIKSFFVLHESSGLALSETGCWHKICAMVASSADISIMLKICNWSPVCCRCWANSEGKGLCSHKPWYTRSCRAVGQTLDWSFP